VKQTTVPLNVVSTGSPTPLPWAVERFGGTQSAAPGINGSTFTLTDSGFGPSGTTDNFQYTYRLTEGDLTMSAKITAMAWAWWGEPNACLMVRQSLAADSPFAAACFKVSPVTNSVEAEFRTRPRPGYPVSIVKGLTVAMPYWFRLDRRGNAYTARISSDGQKWTTVAASAEVAMPTVAFAGVGYGSGHATGSLSTTLQEVGVHAQAGAGADFLLAASPSDFYVAKNRRAYYSVDLDRLNGFAGEAQLAVAGVPAGVTLTATNPQTAIGGLLQFDVDATAVAGSYPLVVTGTHEGTTRQQTVRLHIADAVATALPGPWAGTYLGAQSANANSSFANGVFAVGGYGCCLSGTDDRAQFTFQPVQGNATIVARLTTAGSFYSTLEKAGILLRSDLGPASPFVFLGIVNNASAVLQVRGRETLPVETKATVGSRPAPRWLKLERNGTEIRAYLSADGVAWEAVGQPYTFASLPERVFVGLVASPELSATAWTANFEGVSVGVP
jgi:regulation of enolase protein 1 (concanavalin A-like superfamily)